MLQEQNNHARPKQPSYTQKGPSKLMVGEYEYIVAHMIATLVGRITTNQSQA